ncbi:Demethylrebeccamycin-D-glucose O-methyltransferase [Maioricimonas rarisocia]|uniref:Demethylrebeccamycin-D-glucose O-methyltransferase n=1 Tax=Maioricimonas rarisocia TaxID=2528026 RepID=A0A517Z174_9PLAN|nr:class I SAM-dependent methyltransferase [Maioricimonas rarisocia]QDU36225.1 Demethylrebeccamycin-D-glucose O-methyltransferase [Maioricimonas rarisocia]
MSQQIDVYEAQQQKFDNREFDLDSVRLDHYQKPRFGPWCPYWSAYSKVAERVEPGKRLLVVGSGYGRDALIYASLGYQVDGIDLSRKCVETSRELARRFDLTDRATFHQQPAEALEFDDATFDAAVGIDIIHHVDTQTCVDEIYRVLKPGGWAVFREPRLTPFRDLLRNSPPVTWILPKGVKSLATGSMHFEDAPGEKNLDGTDFRIMRERFGNLKVTRFHVIAKLSSLFGRRPMLERWDHQMFKLLPFMRWFGDQMTLEVHKQA